MTRSRKEVRIALALVGVITFTSYQIGRILGERDAATKLSEQLQRVIRGERHSEAEALEQAYGPSRNSEHEEEWILKDFFKGERDGVFVDVGANHHQRFSNTYYLETELGWSGVAIEPQRKFADGYRKHRPRTRFVPLFVSDVSNRQATLYVTGNDLVASGVRNFSELFGQVTPTTTTTTTLDDVLDRIGIHRVDFLSMDIELGEPRALAGFSIHRFIPRLVTVEAHPPVRQEILDYFARHGYVLVGKYWRADDANFWFAPLEKTGMGRSPVAADTRGVMDDSRSPLQSRTGH